MKNHHVPIAQLKKHIDAAAQEPLMLIEILSHVIRLAVQRKVLGKRKIGDFAAEVERQTAGL